MEFINVFTKHKIDNSWIEFSEDRSFCVEIVCWYYIGDIFRWNVYANIYKNHPLWDKLDKTSLTQDILIDMPLHCGPSHWEWIVNKELEKVGFRSGSDYCHLCDEVGCDSHIYDHCSPECDKKLTDFSYSDIIPIQIVIDAKRLFVWLEEGYKQDIE